MVIILCVIFIVPDLLLEGQQSVGGFHVPDAVRTKLSQVVGIQISAVNDSRHAHIYLYCQLVKELGHPVLEHPQATIDGSRHFLGEKGTGAVGIKVAQVEIDCLFDKCCDASTALLPIAALQLGLFLWRQV